ncbi:MAG: hypothetical protein R2697_17875 [Ilumatobacteraceae bacterium]
MTGPGEVRTLCTLPEGIADITWSPDGKQIGFISRTATSGTTPRT